MTPVLFWRSRGLVWLGAGIAVVGAASWWVPLGLVENPFNAMRLSVVECVPGLGAGVFVSLLVANPMPELEGTASRPRLWRARLSWLMLALVGFAAIGATLMLVRPGGGAWLAVVHVRACAVSLGLGVASGTWLPRQVAWLPSTAYLVACWLGGIVDLIGSAAWWAVPCYLADSWLAACAASCAFLAGVVVYVARGGWPLSAGE